MNNVAVSDRYVYSAARQTRSSSESPPDITEVPDMVSACVGKKECNEDDETVIEQSTNEICNDVCSLMCS